MASIEPDQRNGCMEFFNKSFIEIGSETYEDEEDLMDKLKILEWKDGTKLD